MTSACAQCLGGAQLALCGGNVVAAPKISGLSGDWIRWKDPCQGHPTLSTSDLAYNALRYAVAARSPMGTIVHSDRD